MDAAGALQRVLNVRTDILIADMSMEVGALHEIGGLIACAAQEQVATGASQCFGELLERTESGRIECRHVAQPEHDHRRQTIELIQNRS
jgi:hypothetical protein